MILAPIGLAFAWLGSRGPAILALSLAAGAALPVEVARPAELLPAAAFLMTLGSLLAARLAVSETILPPRYPLCLAAVWVGPAALTALVLRLADIPGDIALGALASTIGPPVASAAALAAMLGLAPRMALALALPPLLLAPAVAPALWAALGAGDQIDLGAVAVGLFAIVGAAAAVAGVAHLAGERAAPLLPSPRAAAGVSVIGLAVVGLAAAQTARRMLALWPESFPALLAAAFAHAAALWVVGALVFAPMGWRFAMTVGLVFGNRNQTLVWAAAGPMLAPLGEAYLVASILPILTLPLLHRIAAAPARWSGRAAARLRAGFAHRPRDGYLRRR